MSGAGQLVVQAAPSISTERSQPPAKSPSAEATPNFNTPRLPCRTGHSECRDPGGSANMTPNGGFHWSGGEMTGTGTTTLGGTATLDGLDKYLTGNRQVASSGTTFLSEANLNFHAPGDEFLVPRGPTTARSMPRTKRISYCKTLAVHGPDSSTPLPAPSTRAAPLPRRISSPPSLTMQAAFTSTPAISACTAVPIAAATRSAR